MTSDELPAEEGAALEPFPAPPLVAAAVPDAVNADAVNADAVNADAVKVSEVVVASEPRSAALAERTLKLTLEYDGTAYMGWQLQPRVPTIQGELESRLERILGKPHRVHGAGRTNAGVHARGQVAHLHTQHPMTAETLKKALNALLPPDIVVRALEQVPATFHARFQEHRKLYAYQLWLRPERSPFMARYAWHLPKGLDLLAMQQALTLLEGTHDFGAFRAADCGAQHAVRTLYAARVVQHAPAGLVKIELEGNGFLKHMVRNIVGTVVEVGQGRRSLASFAEVFEGRARTRAGKTAPAEGLWLEWVAYGASPQSMTGVTPALLEHEGDFTFSGAGETGGAGGQ